MFADFQKSQGWVLNETKYKNKPSEKAIEDEESSCCSENFISFVKRNYICTVNISVICSLYFVPISEYALDETGEGGGGGARRKNSKIQIFKQELLKKASTNF